MYKNNKNHIKIYIQFETLVQFAEHWVYGPIWRFRPGHGGEELKCRFAIGRAAVSPCMQRLCEEDYGRPLMATYNLFGVNDQLLNSAALQHRAQAMLICFASHESTRELNIHKCIANALKT